jgi:hypothetical protein
LLLNNLSPFNQIDISLTVGHAKSGTNFESKNVEASVFLFVSKPVASNQG